MHQLLPLHDLTDSHEMLLAVRDVGTLRDVAGSEGWLQIYARHSDLLERRYDEVVSFLRST